MDQHFFNPRFMHSEGRVETRSPPKPGPFSRHG
jgi:hypothetical protein